MDMQYPTNDLLTAIIESDAVIVVYVHIGVVNYAILTSILVTISRYIHYLESVYSRDPPSGYRCGNHIVARRGSLQGPDGL